MKSVTKRVFAILLIALLVFGIAPLTASAATATELAAQLNAISGLSASVSGNTVNVSGSRTNVSAPLVLNLDSVVTVNWGASYTGAVSPATTSMLTIDGSGTFNVNTGGTINNIGTGNTLNLVGSGTTITVNTGGSVLSERSGNALLLNGDSITVNVNSGGSVISADGNVNAALQIGSSAAILGTRVNITGGSVVSVGTGFAINDGAGTALVDNNTVITVSGGVVTAGGNSAIHSTGIRSTVAVTGGIISNAAGNNLNPTIDMQGDMNAAPPPSYNISVSGTAIVQSTSVNGYTLQSKGNIRVQNYASIAAINGRAINLVGADSVARIEGGLVETTGNGTVISTATTDPTLVPRASVIVTSISATSPATVRSANGIAINTTGVDSKVTVEGYSFVSTTSSSNHAINASGSNATIAIAGNAVVSAMGGDAIRTTATNTSPVSTVEVSGNAKVSSLTGRAIQANGAGATVLLRNSCQVYVFNVGNAIRCTSGTVTLHGGFVFAYGANALNVINSPNIPYNTSDGPLVVAWNRAAGNRLYLQGTSLSANPDLDVEVVGQNSHFWWYNHPTLGGGINIMDSPNVGFFQLPEVTIFRDFGLIFDSSTGFMHENRDRSGNPAAAGNIRTYEGYSSLPQRWTATGPAPYTLVLNGFSWNTSEPVALTIVGSTTVRVNGNSSFESTFVPVVTLGAVVSPEVITALDTESETNGAEIIDDEINALDTESETTEEEIIDDEINKSYTGNETTGVEMKFEEINASDTVIVTSGAGIRFGQASAPGTEVITIEGTHTLTALGRNTTGGYGIDIRQGRLAINNGTIIAQGGEAIFWDGSDHNRVVPPATGDYIWNYCQTYDGSSRVIGYGGDDPFVLTDTDRFVLLKTVTPINFTGAIQRGGASRVADSVAIELTFSSSISGLTADDIRITNRSGEAVKGMLTGSGTTWTLMLNRVDVEGTVDIRIRKFLTDYYLNNDVQNNVQVFKAEINRFTVTLSNTVEPGGDMDKFFEYEVVFADDPRDPQAKSLSTSLWNANTVFVTFADGSPLPASRITGTNNTVLLLKHNEAVTIYNLPPGGYYILEHANVGFITAFNVNSEGYFTAPDGISRAFTLSDNIVVESYNSTIPEIPGEPSRPFNPNNPGGTRSPQTGDDRNQAQPLAMLMLGLLLLAGAEGYRRKKKKASKKK